MILLPQLHVQMHAHTHGHNMCNYVFCELVIMVDFMCQSDIWLNITIDLSVRLLLGGTYINWAVIPPSCGRALPVKEGERLRSSRKNLKHNAAFTLDCKLSLCTLRFYSEPCWAWGSLPNCMRQVLGPGVPCLELLSCAGCLIR